MAASRACRCPCGSMAARAFIEERFDGRDSESGAALVDTYKSGAEALADKRAQVALVAALSSSSTSLRRDECGAWRINGRRGHSYAWGDNQTAVMYVDSGSARSWTSHKRRLGFCRVTQNGDTEGCLRLMALPTPQQAAVIREVLGVRKRGSANQGLTAKNAP